MNERAGWRLVAVAAFLACGVAPRPSAGQPPPTANPSATALPSSVSPDIERFVRRSGRDVPPPVPTRATGPLSPQPAGDRPATTPSPASADVGRMPQAIPARPHGPVPVAGTPDALAPAGASSAPLAAMPALRSAPFAPGDLRFPINLATALRLSDARPLIVAAAQAKVWVAEAELTQAKVLWVPDAIAGFDYLRHEGGGPDFNKGIMTAPSMNFFYGGAGLNLFLGAADAIYRPLSARQLLNSRQWDVQCAKNDALMQTADAYFMVHQSRGIYTSTLYTVERGKDLVDKIASLSRDLVSEFEVDRARNVLADLSQHSVAARQEWRVQSARLTKVLRLDPRAVVEPLEHDHAQITLIDPGRELDDLMPIALANRPEIASRAALVAAAEVDVRRERARPFIPNVLLNGFQTPAGMLYQAGIFGLGPNSSLNQWRGREDVSIQCVWQLQNFGFGNLARIKDQRGRESKAIVELRRAQDDVAEEVNQAHARVQSAAVRVVQAERSVRTGIVTLNGATEGLGQTSRFGDVLVLISRPQEAIYALQLLQTAFDEYFTTVAEYNRAQFALFHALGYPAREIAELHPPGEVQPVNTSRPAYLPPVGNGPPPATR